MWMYDSTHTQECAKAEATTGYTQNSCKLSKTSLPSVGSSECNDIIFHFIFIHVNSRFCRHSSISRTYQLTGFCCNRTHCMSRICRLAPMGVYAEELGELCLQCTNRVQVQPNATLVTEFSEFNANG